MSVLLMPLGMTLLAGRLMIAGARGGRLGDAARGAAYGLSIMAWVYLAAAIWLATHGLG